MHQLKLHGTPKTRLNSLYGKAKESEPPDSLRRDPFSRRVVEQIDDDLAGL